jgi:choice-of-anchor C domain-containing protein
VYLRGRYEVQLIDDPNRPGVPNRRCGAIWGRIAPIAPAYLGPRQWNHLLARLERKSVTVIMNGRTIIENQLILGGPTSSIAVDDLEDQPGPILLSNEATIVRFKNLQIRRLNANKSTATPRKKSENLLVNGSFEDGPSPGDFKPYNPGSRAIPGWKVTRGQIDVLGLHDSAFDGANAVDLHGSPGYGGIEQTFKTVKGHRYRVTFAFTVSPTAKHLVKKIGASAARTKMVFIAESKTKSWKSLDWTTKTFEFTAVADETTLEFYTLDRHDPFKGPLIDDVRVIEQEPNTSASSVAATNSARPRDASMPDAQKDENTERARSFVQLLHRGEFDQAVAQFDAVMQKALPADHLKKAWQKVLAEAGAYKTILEARTETSNEVVSVTCEFAKHPRVVRVVFKARKISGLWFPHRRPKEESRSGKAS